MSEQAVQHVIGYDLNDQFCQISYFHEGMEEPLTREVLADNYKIPLVLGTRDGRWLYGQEAAHHADEEPERFCDRLFSRALAGETAAITRSEVPVTKLLEQFIKLSLSEYEQIDTLIFSVPELSERVVRMLRRIGRHIGVDPGKVLVEDYKESFCQFMYDQPKELWQYEAALFYCDKERVTAYMMKQVETEYEADNTTFVMVEEVSHALMSELHVTFPVINVELAMEADMRFLHFVNGVFDKRRISSVFLTGEGFESNWYPETLKVMCNGRRVFLGNNLYSKGACYEAARKQSGRRDGPIYLDESKMTDQVCIKVRVGEDHEWFPIIAWGEHWYESDCTYEVMLENNEPIELSQNSLATGESKIIEVPLDGLPERRNYSMRMQVRATFVDENQCKISFSDMGFGEIFPESGFFKEITVVLGGSNEQFNTLS